MVTLIERLIFKTSFIKNFMPSKQNKSQQKSLNQKIAGIDKLTLVKDVASSVVGKNTAPIVEILFDKKNVNEFLIAKKLDLTINQIRNVLYKLSDEGLVSFIRKKDKKKGWYTYFWTFNSEKAFVLMKKIILKDIEILQVQLKSRESKRFYICKTCSIELTEESALLHNFTCSECGEIYEVNDNSKSIREINSSIDKLKRRLEEVESEIKIIDAGKIKKSEKDMKKSEKDKTEKRKASAKKRSESRMKNIKAKVKIKPKINVKISKKSSGKIVKKKSSGKKSAKKKKH